MRTGWLAAAMVAVFALASLAALTHERPPGPNAVIVELFTSQG